MFKPYYSSSMKVFVFMLKDWLFAGCGGTGAPPGTTGLGAYLLAPGGGLGGRGPVAAWVAAGCSMMILVKFS